MHLGRFTLSFGYIFFIILLLNSIEIIFDIFLTEIFRCSHDFDKVDYVLCIGILSRSTLTTEFGFPVILLDIIVCVSRYHCWFIINYWNIFIMIFHLVFYVCRDILCLGLFDLLLNIIISNWLNCFIV